MQQATTAPRDHEALTPLMPAPLESQDEPSITAAGRLRNWPDGRNGSTDQSAQPFPQVIRSVLVPTDFSPASAAAVKRAVAVANQYNVPLTILHVIDVNAQPQPAESGAPHKIMNRLWDEGTAQMGHLASSLCGQVDARTSLEEGLPWEEIVEQSRKHDLLVLGQDRAKKRWRLFSQRTAQRVLENAGCPVLVVRDQN